VTIVTQVVQEAYATHNCTEAFFPHLWLCSYNDQEAKSCEPLWRLLEELETNIVEDTFWELKDDFHQFHLTLHEENDTTKSFLSSISINMTTFAQREMRWWEGFTPADRHFGYPMDDYNNLILPNAFGESISEALEHNLWSTLEYRSKNRYTQFWNMESFLGPTASIYETNYVSDRAQKSLVVTFAGSNSKTHIDKILGRFGSDSFDIWLFSYDDTYWLDHEWAKRTTTTIISARRKMKWWYVKRFMNSDTITGNYEYIILLDDDVDFSFNPSDFVAEMRSQNILLGQPVHSNESYTTHSILYATSEQRTSYKGIWTNFIECGPFVAIHSAIWPCIQSVLQSDLLCGYGYDLVWVPVCAPTNSAVLYDFELFHKNTKAASEKPNFHARCVAEAVTLFARLRHGPLSTQDNSSDCVPDYALRSVPACHFTTRRAPPFILETTDTRFSLLRTPIFPVEEPVALGLISRNARPFSVQEMVEELAVAGILNAYNLVT
jgi:hypothetical protein